MSLETGIVGLANSGKSTLFNAITRAGAEVASYPFCTVEPNMGVVAVPDQRLSQVAQLVGSATRIPTTIRYVDIAGLVRGASRGEGLGNQFLGHIRNMDALIHVVRSFEDPTVAHPDGSIDPLRDLETVETELCLADLAVVERNYEKLAKAAKSGSRYEELPALERARERLDLGQPLLWAGTADEDLAHLGELQLLTAKPVIYLANVGEDQLGAEEGPWDPVRAVAEERGAPFIRLCAKLEEELAELEADEEAAFLEEMGIDEPGLDRLIHATYDLLGLITFFTIESNQTRAWTVPKGTPSQEAAGKIHSDMERGFIRAEVVSYGDLATAGSIHHAREQGRLRMEGRKYQVTDGDIITFRFAV